MSAVGIERLHVPIRDGGAPNSSDLTTGAAYLASTLADRERCVFVSCRAGNERTAAILIAFTAIEHCLDYDEALQVLRLGRPSLHPLPDQERAVRTFLANQSA